MSLSIYSKGKWYFATPSSQPTTKGDMKYYKINFDFGLAKAGTLDPSDVILKGKKGEYVGVNSNGVYIVLTKKMYDQVFPQKIVNPLNPSPLSSKVLTEDKNFLTNIFKGTATTDSNTVVITPVPTTLPTSTGTIY